jgi:uncharacterized membrane protein YvbJ
MNTKLFVGFLFCVVLSVVVGLIIGSYMSNSAVNDTSESMTALDKNVESQIAKLEKALNDSQNLNEVYDDQILIMLNDSLEMKKEIAEWKEKYDKKRGGGSTRIIHVPIPGY